MKKPYKTPKLTIHGNIENLTQMLGEASAQDALVWAGDPIARSSGAKPAAGGSFDLESKSDLDWDAW
ncbi:MAG: putative RiPP precursor [Cyanobacteria bacterium QH_2_48_84]|nr:MAG: putative RiPP precursor [Cyanobacteria bacterium QH_2_48_84]